MSDNSGTPSNQQSPESSGRKRNERRGGGGSQRGGGGGRGRGGTHGGRGSGRARAPVHNHKVDMKKYEKLIGEHEANFSDIKQTGGPTDECSICCKPSDIFGLGTCRHPVCIECAIRIRVLGNQKTCPVCRSDVPTLHLIFAQKGISLLDAPLIEHLSGHADEERYGIRFENSEVGKRYEKYLAHVCRLCTDDDGERLEFPSFISLRQHMARLHNLSYCHICTENLNLFSRERRTYNRDTLQRHIRHGDPEDKSQKGHPNCLFCDQRFFDAEAQFRHLRKDHFFCQFCEAEGTTKNLFFGVHEELLNHYKEKHYLCEVPECRQMGIAFATTFEFNLHKSQHDKKKVQLDFQFSDRQVVGHGRTRRAEPAPQPSLSQPQGRIAVIPQTQQSTQPPRQSDNMTFVRVPSAQKTNPSICYHRGPNFVPESQDFPSLAGSSSAPVLELPEAPTKNDFPRLNKVGRPKTAAELLKMKEEKDTKKNKKESRNSADDFPTLGGTAAQTSSNADWGRSTPKKKNLESVIIDDDEQIASNSRPIQFAVPKAKTNGTAKPAPSRPTEDFPALPIPSRPFAALPSTSNWANKAKGKSAIVGVKVPKKVLPTPDMWPDRPPQPSKPYEPPVEVWEEVPVTKKPPKMTKKERREQQKKKTELLEKEQEEEAQEFKEKMMVAPDYDLEMQAVLMNDILRTIHSHEPDIVMSDALMVNADSVETLATSSNNNSKNKNKKKQNKKNNVVELNPANENSVPKTTQPPVQLEKKQEERKAPEHFPELTRSHPAPESVKTEEPSSTEQGNGLGSWFSSVSSMLSGLSLSNVLGDHSGPLSAKSNAPNSASSSNANKTSPGITTMAKQSPPVELTNNNMFFPPPGFEHIKISGPPPGLPKPTSAQNQFESAPFFTEADIRPPPQPVKSVNSDGWTNSSRKKK